MSEILSTSANMQSKNLTQSTTTPLQDMNITIKYGDPSWVSPFSSKKLIFKYRPLKYKEENGRLFIKYDSIPVETTWSEIEKLLALSPKCRKETIRAMVSTANKYTAFNGFLYGIEKGLIEKPRMGVF